VETSHGNVTDYEVRRTCALVSDWGHHVTYQCDKESLEIKDLDPGITYEFSIRTGSELGPVGDFVKVDFSTKEGSLPQFAGDASRNRTPAWGGITAKSNDPYEFKIRWAPNGKIAIAAPTGYLRADNRGGEGCYASSRAVLEWELWTLQKTEKDGVYGFKSSNGRFLSASNGGGIYVDVHGTSLREWEHFEVVPASAIHGGSCTLRAPSRHFVTAHAKE